MFQKLAQDARIGTISVRWLVRTYEDSSPTTSNDDRTKRYNRCSNPETTTRIDLAVRPERCPAFRSILRDTYVKDMYEETVWYLMKEKQCIDNI